MANVFNVISSIVVVLGISFLLLILFSGYALYMVDAIIPLSFGIILAVFSQSFAKCSSPRFPVTEKRMKAMGIVLICVGILYFIITCVGGSV